MNDYINNILNSPDFKTLVYWAMPSNITFPYNDMESFDDLVHEVKVSIFNNLHDKEPKELAHTTIIVNHTRWVFGNQARYQNRKHNVSNVNFLDETVIDKNSSSSYEDIDNKDLYDKITGPLKSDKRNYQIFEGRLKGERLVDLGKKFGVSKERCRQIYFKTIERLREDYANRL